jgi:CheY-like chemotaxis protein
VFTFDLLMPLQAGQVRSGLAQLSVQGKRALVIDDNAAARGLLVSMLAALGLHARQARSCFDGEALIDDARQGGKPFDIILLDGRMPEVDGVGCPC